MTPLRYHSVPVGRMKPDVRNMTRVHERTRGKVKRETAWDFSPFGSADSWAIRVAGPVRRGIRARNRDRGGKLAGDWRA